MIKKIVAFFKNYGFYLYPVFVLVVVIILFVKVDLPKFEEMSVLRRELSGIKERLAKLQTKSSLLTSLNEEKLKGDYEKVGLVLPDAKDAPSILRNLETSASSSGALLESLDLAPGKLATTSAAPKEKPNEVSIKAGIDGTTPQITAYLGRIALVGRAIEIKNVEVTYSEKTTTAKGTLELVAYFLSPAETTGKVEEALPTWGVEEDATLVKIANREILAPSLIIPPSGKPDLFK